MIVQGRTSLWWEVVFACALALVAGRAAAISGLGFAARGETGTDGFEARRARLLTMLTSPEMLKGDIDSGGYSYRRRWQHYNACLAKGIDLKEANRYFAESEELEADEWPVLLYVRTYFAFKDTTLTEAARKRLADLMLDYRRNAPRSKSIEQFGTNGNHSIVNFSMYLLLDQEFGNGPKHDVVRDKFIKWVQYQGRFGRDEVNSPHYLERSLLPLLNLYDFLQDSTLKLWAQMAIDQMLAEFAILSLDNVRGGPWCRAHQHHSPGVEEINDGTQDSFYVVGYQFFGNSAFPTYPFTDQILSYGFITTTSYRPPTVITAMADRRNRGRFEFKSHHRSVFSKPSPGPIEWDMYYYVTPSYSLGSLQDRVELDNHVTGRVTRDFKNTQVWELTFADPRKILGPKRDLRVGTGETRKFVEERNPNTANMQYKNVLFYKGEFLDYNGNLASGGGQYVTRKQADRECHFWRIPARSDVYVGLIHFPSAGGGIVEVGTGAESDDFASFCEEILDRPAECRDAGLYTRYVNRQGDVILYDKGKATVNGRSWPIHGYPSYESPCMKAEWGSGVIDMAIGGHALHLDFRNVRKPVRRQR